MSIKLAISLPETSKLSFYHNHHNFYDKIGSYLDELQQKGIIIIKVTDESEFDQYNLDGTPSFSIWTHKTNKWQLLHTLGPELEDLTLEVNSIISTQM